IRDDRAASQQQKQAAHARSATAKPLYATPSWSASLLGFNGSAASSSVGNTTPRTSSASYSSLASLSSSGDFEIGSSHVPLRRLRPDPCRRARARLPRPGAASSLRRVERRGIQAAAADERRISAAACLYAADRLPLRH